MTLSRLGVPWLLLLALVTITSLPAFKAFAVYSLVLFCCTLSLSIAIFALTLRSGAALSIFWLLGHLLFFMTATLGIFSGNTALVGRFAEYLIIANLVQIYCLSSYKNIASSLSGVVKYVFFLNSLTAFTTLAQIYFDPAAARMVTESAGLRLLNVGGYEFVYAQLFMVLAWSLKIEKEREKNGSVGMYSFAGFSLSVVVVLLSNFLIAVSLLMIVLCYLFMSKAEPFPGSAKNLRCFFLVGSLCAVGYFLSVIADSDLYMLRKMFEIVSAVISDGESGYLSERILKYKISIYGFQEFPLTGALIAGEYLFNWKYYGRHSYILDAFALFGIMGFIYVYFLVAPLFHLRPAGVVLPVSKLFGVAIFLLVAIAGSNIITAEIIIATYLILLSFFPRGEKKSIWRLAEPGVYGDNKTKVL